MMSWRPATEALKSHFDSAQKTTAAGANWEIFGFDSGGPEEFTSNFTCALQHLGRGKSAMRAIALIPAGSALGSVLNRDSIWNWTVIQASQRKGGLNGKAGLLAQRCGMAAD